MGIIYVLFSMGNTFSWTTNAVKCVQTFLFCQYILLSRYLKQYRRKLTSITNHLLHILILLSLVLWVFSSSGFCSSALKGKPAAWCLRVHKQRQWSMNTMFNLLQVNFCSSGSFYLVHNLQINQQHGTNHHDKAAKRGIEIDDAEQNGSTWHCVHPVQPISVELIVVQHGSSLSVHLDVGVGRAVLGGGVGPHRGWRFVRSIWLSGGASTGSGKRGHAGCPGGCHGCMTERLWINYEQNTAHCAH